MAARADLVGLRGLFDNAGHATETEPETGQELDGEILEDERQAFTDEVFEEFHYRADVLEGRYPFRGKRPGLAPVAGTRRPLPGNGGCAGGLYQTYY